MSKKSFSEDEMGRRLDRCLTDGVLKTAGGGLLGAVFSLLFLRRRLWPVLVGMGFGIGMAYGNCEHEMNAALCMGNQVPSRACPPVKKS